VPLHVRMGSRDPDEEHRSATPLELIYDLTFAAAVALGSEDLARGLESGHPEHVLIGFPLVFFGIWWGWMNFTWFASAYDTDDTAYRLAVLVQMTGVLILAAGVGQALAHWQFGVMTAGYVVMRLSMAGLWLRAAAGHSAGRRCALRYAAGISAVQIAWVARLALPTDIGLAAFGVLGALELAVPVWAESAGRTPWNPGHIAERYGLFTIIVLGESILAATNGVQAAIDGTTALGALAPTIVGGLLIVFSMWWLYFDMPSATIVAGVRRAFEKRLNGAFVWGYGHVVVFASAAAVGAGLAVTIDRITHHAQLSALAAGFTVTAPVACYLLAVWALHAPYKPPGPLRSYAAPVGAALILAATPSGQPVLAAGLVLALLVAAGLLAGHSAADPDEAAATPPSG
jgi:low temperature requirement protein LtrA